MTPTPIRRWLLAVGLSALAMTLGMIAGAQLPQHTLPVVLGALAGMGVSVPTTLLIVWGVNRRRAQPAARPTAAPTRVTVVPPAPPPRPEAGTDTPPPPPTGLVHEKRPAAIIGGTHDANA